MVGFVVFWFGGCNRCSFWFGFLCFSVVFVVLRCFLLVWVWCFLGDCLWFRCCSFFKGDFFWCGFWCFLGVVLVFVFFFSLLLFRWFCCFVLVFLSFFWFWCLFGFFFVLVSVSFLDLLLFFWGFIYGFLMFCGRFVTLFKPYYAMGLVGMNRRIYLRRRSG